jgi:hypothetical protein
MRNAVELIAELEEHSTQHSCIAMAVGFEDSTVFITPDDPNRLQLLHDAINAGGRPIGLIAADMSERSMALMHTIYPENEEDAELFDKYLEALEHSFARSLVDKCGGEITRCDEQWPPQG